MSRQLFLGTRKGLITVVRHPDGWAVDAVEFLSQPVPMLLPATNGAGMLVALDHGHFGNKVHRRGPDGTWAEVGVPSYPQTDGEGGDSLQLLWILERDGRGGLWAGTIPGGLFHSADDGDTWQLNQALWDEPSRPGWFGGGFDKPGIHSICVHPEDPDDVVVGISCGGAWRTRDGGDSWTIASTGMAADYMPPDRAKDPTIQDPHRIVQCAANPDRLWAQHHCGTYRSDDRGSTWVAVTNGTPNNFGFGVAVDPTDGDIAYFAPAVKDETRVPIDTALMVTRTEDAGATATARRLGLPQTHCFDLIYRHALELAPDGRTLAMASTTGNLWISEDAGDRWTLVSSHLPPVFCARFG